MKCGTLFRFDSQGAQHFEGCEGRRSGGGGGWWRRWGCQGARLRRAARRGSLIGCGERFHVSFSGDARPQSPYTGKLLGSAAPAAR